MGPAAHAQWMDETLTHNMEDNVKNKIQKGLHDLMNDRRRRERRQFNKLIGLYPFFQTNPGLFLQEHHELLEAVTRLTTEKNTAQEKLKDLVRNTPKVAMSESKVVKGIRSVIETVDEVNADAEHDNAGIAVWALKKIKTIIAGK